MKFVRAMLLLLVTTLVGCAAPLVQPAADQTVPNPPADKAQIVFVNPSNAVAGAFMTQIYEVKPASREVFGMIGSKMKLVRNVDPGKHVFLGQTLGLGYQMEANVEAGKRYYVVLRFIYGRGHELRPVHAQGDSEFSVNNPKFPEWIADAQLTELTPAADEWYTKFRDLADEAQKKAEADWNAKSDAQKAELTLTPADAINR